MYIYQRLMVFALLISTIFLATSPSYVEQLAFTQGRAKNLTGYENPTYRIKLQYPSNWTRIEPNRTSSQDNIRMVVILRTPVTTNINSSSFASMSIQIYNGSIQIGQFIQEDLFLLNQPQLHFHIISKNTTNLAGGRADEVVFTYQTPVSNRKVLKIYEENGPQIYILAYNADSRKYDYYLPTIRKIIDSIEITK